MSDYVELRCRSAFSFLEGASNPEDLVDEAVRLGHGALALGDKSGLYGAPRFHQAARRTGLRAIVGAEVDLGPPSPGQRVGQRRRADASDGGQREDRQGDAPADARVG